METEETILLKEFTPDQLGKLREIINKHRGKPGGLIPVLEEAQVLLGYLPVPIQRAIAAGLNLPLSRVYGVVTFYSFFTMIPRGKHTVRVCLGTACYVRGGKDLAETLEQDFSVKPGDTTTDRLFTFETVRCIGACGLAPAVIVDEEVYGGVKPANIKTIMAKYS